MSKRGCIEHMYYKHSINAFSCYTCGKTFPRKSNLINHTQSHSGERPYICQHCGRGFRTKSNLNSHVTTHTVKSTVECKDCSKTFRFKASFIKHNLCRFILVTLIRTTLMTLDRRIHTGDKPYACTKSLLIKSSADEYWREAI
ncbi:unnamed protein product [Acanthoscelides obtectus]|uniref:C2H2-type domain-containing protein n=1 Tax=Acanthoscelides obtectus TaxID=200917 RepID=A0A9P0JS55_ACAOB|nr:unnamed protein product [Acanthoscelides obtectus]CAK1663715.1 Zinc finger protein 684 [Acanthoscelides obtectus]